MNPNSRLPTAAEEESIKRRIELVHSMIGTNTDTALTVLLYVLAERTVGEGIAPESLISNFASIYTQVNRGNDVSH